MACLLDRFPQRRRSSSGTISRPPVMDRVGCGLATTAGNLARRAHALGDDPNDNQAGTDRAAVMAGDVMRYAAGVGLELTIEQARGVLDRCGWLTYGAMTWIDRLVVAAARDREPVDVAVREWPPEGRIAK
jgi:hypothetical protein